MTRPGTLSPVPQGADPPHGKRWIRARILKLNRTLHIYLTLLGLATMVFFAITGFILNHDEWFDRGTPVTRTVTGQLPVSILRPPDKLAIAEKLRSDFQIHGIVDAFNTGDDIQVTYKGPGHRADAVINPETGAVEVTFESRGLIARMSDLHRGKFGGKAWNWIIDIAAALIAVGALTGVLLWWHLPNRRRLGTAALLVGLLASLAVYFLLVP